MNLIKFDNIADLYPDNADELFFDAFENYIKKGKFWDYYYNVLDKHIFFPVFRGMTYDKKWANFGHLVAIINDLIQKENYGFEKKNIDNHHIVVLSSQIQSKHLPCTLCSSIQGDILNFQQFVCEMPLSKLECRNLYGRCLGRYQLVGSNNEMIKDHSIVVVNGKLKMIIKI